MLILSREVGETLTIGDDITVTVLRIQGCQVRFAIHAPADVAVHREEIYKRIQQGIPQEAKKPKQPLIVKKRRRTLGLRRLDQQANR